MIGVADQSSADQIPPVTTPGALLQAIAFAAVGGESRVSVIVIVSLVPELPNGKPALSSGVERELQHAFEGGKEVYVVWMCRAMPSPFVTETAAKVFKSTAEAVEYFARRGYLGVVGNDE